MFFVWALLFLGAPSYFRPTPDGRIAWYVGGIAFAVIAFAGALTELANVPGREALSDFAVALLLGAIMTAFGVPPLVWHIGGPWNGLLKTIALLFALLTALGLSAGVGHLFSQEARASRRRTQRSPADTLLSVVIGTSALATAAVNLWAALATKH